jgi:hypothetical protein
MPMKMLGWVLSSTGLLLAAGCAHKPPPTAATGPTSPEGSPIHQPAGDEHVQTYDLHRSGKPDVWVYSVTTQDASGRPVERRVRKEADLSGDGRVDIVDYFDEAGQVTRETLDLDYDGKVDSTLYFEKGKKIRSEKDLDGDGRVDTWSYYDADEKLSRKERDVKGTGKVDYWEYWENGAIDRIGEDLDGDGQVDRWTKGSDAATAGK